MEWIVTNGRTVEEATDRLLDMLGIDISDAEIQVLEEAKTGLFGRTKSEARVRARIKPKAPPAKQERPRGDRDRNRNRNRGGRNRGGGGGNNRGGNNRGGGGNNRGGDDGGNRGGGRKQNQGGNNRGGGGNSGRGNSNAGDNNSGRGRGNSAGRNDGNADGGRTAAAAAAGAGAAAGAASSGGNSGGGNSGGGNSGGGGRNRNRNRNRNRGGSNRDDNRGGGRDRQNDDRVEVPIEEQRATLRAFVTGVAASFDEKASITLVEEGTTLQAQVAGDNLGDLIGNKASTLQALEELSRTAMHRAAGGRRYHRIQVDVDGYRARRKEALVRFAQQIATSVADTGVSKAMEPMGAADRKTVHDAIGEVAGVETVSEGRDPNRYIVIHSLTPADEEE